MERVAQPVDRLLKGSTIVSNFCLVELS